MANKVEIYNEIKDSFELWKTEIMKKHPVDFDNYGGVIYIFINENHPEYKNVRIGNLIQTILDI